MINCQTALTSEQSEDHKTYIAQVQRARKHIPIPPAPPLGSVPWCFEDRNPDCLMMPDGNHLYRIPGEDEAEWREFKEFAASRWHARCKEKSP